jgi:hypothetical protein
MYKLIPVFFAVVAAGAYLTINLAGDTGQTEVEVASLDGAGMHQDHSHDGAGIFGGLKSMVGLGGGHSNISPEEAAKEHRLHLRQTAINSFLPVPDEDEDILVGWERLPWEDHFSAAFGAPDNHGGTGPEAIDVLQEETAIYLKGRSLIYVRVSYSEPTELLAKRLRQSYWVVETDRDLERLQNSRPRPSYIWTNVTETLSGFSIRNMKDHEHFALHEGVYFITAQAKKKNYFDKLRYFYGALGGGVTIKVRAESGNAAVNEILSAIDYQSLNQMQALPSPLVAEGLSDVVLRTPDEWLKDQAAYKAAPVILHEDAHAEDSDQEAQEAAHEAEPEHHAPPPEGWVGMLADVLAAEPASKAETATSDH